MAQNEGKLFKFESPESIKTEYLEIFSFEDPNQLIITETEEFSAVCPFSGLPDIAKLVIKYHAKGGFCIELKSLKYYLVSFRNVGLYQEGCTLKIYTDLKKILCTNSLEVTTIYNLRGGFKTTCIKGEL